MGKATPDPRPTLTANDRAAYAGSTGAMSPSSFRSRSSMVDLMTPRTVPVGVAARRRRVSDGLGALGLAALSLVVHLPLRTTMLYAWDSVLYVEALERFDIGQHRPQPPG